MKKNLTLVNFEESQFNTVMLPRNLNLRKLLIQNGIYLSKPLNHDPRKILDRLILLLAQLDRTSIKIEALVKNGGFTILNSQVLQSKVPNYKEYINWLISNKIIECNYKCEKGVTSYGYRYCIKYADAERNQKYDITSVKSQIKKTSKIQLGTGTLEQLLLADIESLSINVLKVKSIQKQVKNDKLEEIKDLVAVRLKCPRIEPLVAFFAKRLLRTKVNSWEYSIGKLKKKDFHFKRDNTSLRLHTNLTNLKSEFRNALSYKGLTLYNLDIKNSQPLMVLALFNSNNAALNKILYQLISGLDLTRREMHNLLQLLTSRPLDLIKYETLVKMGFIYEYFAICMNKASNKKFSRNQAKYKLLDVFFQPPRYYTKAFKTFKLHFPTVARVIEIVNKKFTMTNAQANAKGYKRQSNMFSILLQRIESHLLIDQTCGIIKNMNSTIPTITIHDSIATTKQNITIVEQEISKAMLNTFQVLGRLKTEKWA